MKQTKTKLIAAVLVFAILLPPQIASAASLQEQIDSLNAEIKANQDAANAKHLEAATLQQAVNELNASINTAQTALSLTNLKLRQTQDEIDKANRDLDRQKEILKDNLRLVYKQGEVSPLELVASSKNLSDFVAQSQYLNAIKNKINSNLKKIDELKRELNKKQGDLNVLALQQKAQVDGIAQQRAQKANILAQTQGEESKYKELVADLAKKREETNRQIAAAAAAAVRGNYVSQGRVRKGDVIGYMGSTGNSTGSHLHFSVINSSGTYVNPDGAGFAISSIVSGFRTQDFGCTPWTFEPYEPSCATKHWHSGVDVANGLGTPIRTPADGDIIYRGWNAYGYGNMVQIRHDNGYVTLYGHMSSF